MQMVQNEIQDKVIRYNKKREKGREIVCLWGLDSLSLLGQGTIIAWDRTCWRISRSGVWNASFILRVCQELAEAWEGMGGVKRMYAHILDHLSRGSWQNWHVWNSSTPACGFVGPRHDNTLFSKPKVPDANAAGHCANFLWSIDHSTRPILALIEFDGNSGGFRVSGALNGPMFRRNIMARTVDMVLSIGIFCIAISLIRIKSIQGWLGFIFRSTRRNQAALA